MDNFTRAVLAVILAIFVTQVQAQSTPAARVEAFLTNVSADSDNALETLFAGSRIGESKPQAWSTMKAQTKSALAIFGKPIGFEKIGERDFSSSLKRLVYLQKFAVYPVVWHVYFYRAKDEWVANSIVFNDTIGPLLLGL